MFSFDFWSRQFFIEELLAPLAVLVLGVLLGGAVNHRLKELLAGGRFAPDSFAGVFLGTLNNLPRIWGLQLGLYGMVSLASLPESVRWMVSCVIFALLVLSVATVIQRALRRMIDLRAGADGSPVATSLLSNLVGIFVYAAGGVIILDFCGISITPIVTAMGVGGMAIALGLQDMMASLFAGLHLLLSKQVRIGDHVHLDGGAEGQVVDITWRYTKIHTVTNNIIIVPNNKLASSVITNFDMPMIGVGRMVAEDVAFSVAVGVAYDSDLETVERVTLETAREVLARLDPQADTREGSSLAPAVRFHSFGESSIDFNVNIHTTSFAKQYLIRHEFIKALKKRFEAEGIMIPFPIRTIVQK